MLILDTHVLIWLVQGNTQLGKNALSTINSNLKDKQLYVCSISFWEVSMLVEKSRLTINQNLISWRKQLLDNGLNELSLFGDSAINAGQLNDFHGDPADRLIVSTTLSNDAVLCTADRKILSWEKNLSCLNASK